MKNIVILGSTGSIGENALKVAKDMRDRLRVVGLSASLNFRKLLNQAKEFGVQNIVVADKEAASACCKIAESKIRVGSGEKGLVSLVSETGADIILCAISGMAALAPVVAAVRSGIDVALATKEILVAAGEILVPMAIRHNVNFLPVDSEHSAIFQCLCGALPGNRAAWSYSPYIEKIILTASGGPFAGKKNINWERVTLKEALKHPRWTMGKKITIDSATMMNKGLEIVEAMRLFGVPFEKVELLIHPESIVHSMVEFSDGSVLAQMGIPDMRIAIQYSLTWPEHAKNFVPKLNLAKIATLHFYKPDYKRFPCLRLANEAAKMGGTMPAVLSGANEVAVDMFIKGIIAFSNIWNIVEKVMQKHSLRMKPSLEDIIEVDRWSREIAMKIIKSGR